MKDEEVTEALELIISKLGLTDSPTSTAPASTGVKEKVEKVGGLIDRIKDNIAYIVGLPATLGGAFGFLWDSSADEAELSYQVQQLEEAVAEMKAENSLLGGGTKNFALDMSSAPGGSVTVLVVGGIIVIGVALLIWYQTRRRR